MKYFYPGEFNPEKLPRLNIDRQTISLIPSRVRVLEIGCADGFMGEYLIKKKQCRLVGVEIDSQSVKKAKERGLKVIRGDIESKEVFEKLQKMDKFNVILCSSVIEHLKDPQTTLKRVGNLLEKNGFFIISVPNVAHWSARFKIFFGKFPQEQYGIFDENHLHFYTLSSFCNLIKKCGFIVELLAFDPVGGGLPKISRILSKAFPGLFAYQILVKAKKG